MTAKLISAFAPPEPNWTPRNGRNGPTARRPVHQNAPLPPRKNGFWSWISNNTQRFRCWILVLLATSLAGSTYKLSRIGFLSQQQTCWLLRQASRIHAKSVRILMGSSW
jgi:hypothetical protein